MKERNKNQKNKEVSALKLAVLAYCFVFVIKIVAYYVSGVMALFAEALHTLSDIFVSVFLLIALKWSRKEADEKHAFGYGRAQYAAALVAATLFISFTSLTLYKESIPNLLHHVESSYQNVGWAIAVLIISMIVAAAPLISLFRQKNKGAAAKAQLAELFNDQLGLIAALIGTIGILLNHPLADPLASFVVASIIAFEAGKLFRENFFLLVGRSPDDKLIKQLKIIASSVKGVLEVKSIKAEYVGPEDIHADFTILIKSGTSIENAHKIADEIEKRIYRSTSCQHCVIHMENFERKKKKGQR